MEPSTQQSSPAIPIAIISGFAMIALAIFLTSNGNSKEPVPVTANSQQSEEGAVTDGVSRPVDETDYILGNPNAPILMVEYSDYDCPFCKQFHVTMHQIMEEYGVTGQVAWAYRQFPLAQIHPNSPKISEAALCVGDIGGNSAFWSFSDMVFDQREIDAPTSMVNLPNYAEQAGVSNSDYLECMNSGRMQGAVESGVKDGYNAGARGTPYTVLMVGDQEAIINGAQPYDVVKSIVKNLIDQLEGNFDTETIKTTEMPTNASGVPVLE